MKVWTNTKSLDDYINFLPTSKEEAELAVVGSKSINLSEFPNLKGIFRVGVGSDNISFLDAKERNIKIGFPSGKTALFIYEETANFTCHLIMKMLYDNVGDINEWNKVSRKFSKERKLLVVGCGNIGKIVATRMSMFVDVDVYDSEVDELSELEEKIRSADIISLHIPLTDNWEFFDKEKLSWMKDGSVLINTSRGALVSESALYGEISSGRISAAFDVFWEEPYRGKLSKCSGFHMSPHVASTNERFLLEAYKDLVKFMGNI